MLPNPKKKHEPRDDPSQDYDFSQFLSSCKLYKHVSEVQLQVGKAWRANEVQQQQDLSTVPQQLTSRL